MEDKLLDARIKALLMAAVTMAFVIVAITCAMIVGLFVSNDVIDNKDVFGLLSYVMTSVVGAVAGSYATLMGMKGDLLPPPEDRDEPEPEPEPERPSLDEETVVSQPVEVAPLVTQDEPAVAQTVVEDEDDDMEPWEKYRGDLRYDANGDGVVDELDFPDWRKNL